ncbi:protein phosphatase 2C domain-containing protein [Leptothoe sp. LEGE 181152]|nr:protein phosphatase 2C domain-containing protein [Leptothoe sp. LEGE 181152]
MIKCPNPECQAINPEGNEHCTSCQTFLPHRYLWAVGQGKLALDHLDKRYAWQHQQIVLDTEPGIPPVSPEPVPAHIWPYLILASHGLHVPQPYALLNKGTGREMLLLDAAAIAAEPGDNQPKLLPTLMEEWPMASPLRQLNWLWQIAGLWSDFTEQQVASSLLSKTLLRVHGSLVRLLELSNDLQAVTLSDLGKFWQSLVPEAQPSIREFFESLCDQLTTGKIKTPEVLGACLDQAIAVTTKGYQADYSLSVLTDQGPSRKRNEDACYPASGTNQTHAAGPNSKRRSQQPLLLLVCDGIGGHEGGDVASQLAIATIQQQLAPLLDELAHQPQHDPIAVNLAIEQAIGVANDNISEHNDRGQRQARDRMGTTLVMALIVGAQIYIAHVGDSRAYRISANNCRQITFDDDVAAREVRLGYGFYADVVNRPATGALIQALGMGHSTALHVAIKRLILDDDIVLLLCSDGLSDYDRVEQSWQTHLLPVLTGQSKPATAATNLVKLANSYNGHDNVTVGVVAGRAQALKPPRVPIPSPNQLAFSVPTQSQRTVASSQATVIAREAPPAAQPIKKKSSLWPVLIGLVAILGTATTLTMVFFRELSISSETGVPETIQEETGQETQTVGISDDELTNPLLTPGSYLQLSQPVELVATPQTPEDDSSDQLGQLTDGAIVQVLTRQEPAADQSRWVKLKVCAVPAVGQSTDQPPTSTEETGPRTSELDPANSNSVVTTPGTIPLTSGEEGWVLEAELAQIARTAEVLNCPPE